MRVVVFLEDIEVYDEKAYRQMTKSQFLKGYADTDSIYNLKVYNQTIKTVKNYNLDNQ